jgi:hypothetical protein
MNTVIYGYYDHNNLGDELFKLAFKKLFPNNNLIFSGDLTKYYDKIDLVLVGGGDLYNDYFLKNLSKIIEKYTIPVIGFGLGFPCKEINKKYLWMFDSIVTRVRDITILDTLNYFLISDEIMSLPDIIFSLDEYFLSSNNLFKLSLNNLSDVHILIIPSSDRINIYELNNLVNQFNKKYKSCYTNIYDLKKDNHLPGKPISKLEDAIKEIDKSNVVITYKFHSVILSIMRNKLFACHFNSFKVIELLKQIFPSKFYINLIFNNFEEIQTVIEFIINNKEYIYECLDNYKQYVQLIYSKFDGNKFLHKQKVKHKRIKVSYEYLSLLKLRSNNLYNNKIWFNKNVSNKVQIKWIKNDKIKYEKDNRPFNTKTICQRLEPEIQRYGWNYTTNILQSLSSEYGILLDSFLDNSYRSEPYLKPWYGIVHHPKTIPKEYSGISLNRLINSDFFNLSLPYCKGLITLSEYMKNQLEDFKLNIPIFSTFHPMHLFIQKWDYNKWCSNRKIYSIGVWLRNIFSIYRLNYINKYIIEHPYILPPKIIYTYHLKDIPNSVEPYSEYTLGFGSSTCKNVWLYFANQYFHNLGYHLSETLYDIPRIFIIELVICELIKSVKVVEKLKSDDYDNMLTNSVILLDLIEASASDTLLECIMTCTPVYVKRHPAIIEYIGKDYPLLFDEVDQIKVRDSDLQKAHEYLVTLDKYKFTSAAFRDNLLKISK